MKTNQHYYTTKHTEIHDKFCGCSTDYQPYVACPTSDSDLRDTILEFCRHHPSQWFIASFIIKRMGWDWSAITYRRINDCLRSIYKDTRNTNVGLCRKWAMIDGKKKLGFLWVVSISSSCMSDKEYVIRVHITEYMKTHFDITATDLISAVRTTFRGSIGVPIIRKAIHNMVADGKLHETRCYKNQRVYNL